METVVSKSGNGENWVGVLLSVLPHVGSSKFPTQFP